MHILFCGEVGVGKTTAINRLLKNASVQYGFITKIERDTPDEKGLMSVYMHSPSEKNRTYTDENCVGKCSSVRGSSKAFSEVFDTLGVKLLTDIPRGSIVLMDELGFLEKDSPAFLSKVWDIFEGEYTVIGAIKPKDVSYLNRIRERRDVKIFFIDKNNREEICKQAQELFGDNLLR